MSRLTLFAFAAIAAASGCGSAKQGGGMPGAGGATGVPADGGSGGCGADPSRAWRAVASPTQGRLAAIHGSGASDVWAVGEEILRWDGATWSVVDSLDATVPAQRFYSVWVAAPQSPVVGGWDGSVERLVGGAWQRTQLSTGGPADAPPQPIGALWGAGAELWAAERSYGGLIRTYHHNGTSWGAGGFLPHGMTGDVALWGSGATDVWLVGGFWRGGLPDWIAHWSGADFAPIAYSDALHYGGFRGIWGSGPGDIWVVGGPWHWSGSAWQPVDGVNRGVAVWGSSAKDVIILNDVGGVSRWDGGVWCTEALPTDQTLLALWGAGAEDVWAVGEKGTILRFGRR